MKCRAVKNPWWGLSAGGTCACLQLCFAVPDPGGGAELYQGQCNLTTGKKLGYEVCQLRHTSSSDSVEDFTVKRCVPHWKCKDGMYALKAMLTLFDLCHSVSLSWFINCPVAGLCIPRETCGSFEMTSKRKKRICHLCECILRRSMEKIRCFEYVCT